MNSKPLFSLIIPTFNEAENILSLINLVHESIRNHPHEIIVVDDDSPDRTWELVGHFSNSHPWVKIHRRPNRRGLSSAVLEGFGLAGGNFLGVMDADLSHDELILPKLIRKLEEGADLAVGSRRIPGGGATKWPWYRRLTSDGATFLAKALLDIKLSDPMSGYFVLRRTLYENCKERLAPQGYKILLELYCKGRPARVSEVPFVFKNRRQGYSKLSGSVMKQYLQMLLALKQAQIKQGNK